MHRTEKQEKELLLCWGSSKVSRKLSEGCLGATMGRLLSLLLRLAEQQLDQAVWARTHVLYQCLLPRLVKLSCVCHGSLECILGRRWKRAGYEEATGFEKFAFSFHLAFKNSFLQPRAIQTDTTRSEFTHYHTLDQGGVKEHPTQIALGHYQK